MIRKLRWRYVTIAFVLNMILVLSAVQLMPAKAANVKQLQALQVKCSIKAYKPALGLSLEESEIIKAYGYAACMDDFIIKTGMVVELQQYTGGQWVTLGKVTQLGANQTLASARCEGGFEKNRYRTYVTVEYETNTGWHAVSEHGEAEASFPCLGGKP